jgi:hypothetical protein
MRERKVDSVRLATLLAAASTLGLSLGMAQAADTQTTLKHNTGTTEFLKTPTSVQDKHSTQLKYECNQGKLVSDQHKTSTQIKLDMKGPSAQQKFNCPSSELNPQPEPPKPIGQTQGTVPH